MEQLDLFFASCDTEEKLPQKSSLSPLHWKVYNLIYENSIVWHRKTTQLEICQKVEGLEYNEDKTSHDACSKLWTIIKDNNESLEHDKIIISKNFEYWIGSKEETENFLRDLWKALAPRLRRYWLYTQKIGMDGIGKLFDKNGNALTEKTRKFYECFNEIDIEMGNNDEK